MPGVGRLFSGLKRLFMARGLPAGAPSFKGRWQELKMQRTYVGKNGHCRKKFRRRLKGLMFNVYRNKYRAAAGMLAVMLAFCLVLGSVPFAAEAAALTVTADNYTANQETLYTVTAGGFDSSFTVDKVVYDGGEITVTFDNSFTMFSPQEAVGVTFTINGQNYYYQVIPTVSDLTATIDIPGGVLPAEGAVSQIKIVGIEATNPSAGGNYAVTMAFTSTKLTSVTVRGGVTIQDALGSVTVTVDSDISQAGASVTVSGMVKNAADTGVGNKTVDIYLGDQRVATATTSDFSSDRGAYSVTITAPTSVGDYEIKAVCEGISSDTISLSVRAADPVQLKFVDGDEEVIDALTAAKDQVVDLSIQLQDQYGNPVNASSSITVNLAAQQNGVLAGRFYTDGTNSEIYSVTINSGSNSTPFDFKPILGGDINVTARATGLTAAVLTITATEAVKPSKVTLSMPTQAAVNSTVTGVLKLDQKADQGYEFTITAELTKADGTVVDVSPSSPLTINQGNTETTFTLTPSEAGTLKVTVSGNFNAEATTQVIAAMRGFDRDLSAGWNILATPLELAGDGNLAFLLGADASKVLAAYTYDNGQWVQVTDQKLEPLKGYLVKMADGGTAQFSFKNATSPSEIIPKSRALVAGWNLIGVSKATGEELTVADILANVAGKYTTVINPGLVNHADWNACTPESAGGKNVEDGDAYWVYMTQPGTINALAVPNLVAE
jgi:hypothetical protein